MGRGARRTRPLRPAGPAQSRCWLRAERAEHRERAAWGIPRRPGSRGAFAPPPLGPWASRPAPLWEDGAALSGQCAGLRAWSAGGRRGLQAATPSSAPCPGTVGRRAQRSGLRSAAESGLGGAAAATSGQVGAGAAEGRPSGPHAQPAVVARPGNLRPGRRELGSAARGLSLAGGGRACRGAARPGSAQPHWWSLGVGRRLRWRDVSLPGGSPHSAGLRPTDVC